MARRDYKHRATRRKKRQPTPFWIWLLAGYLAGAASVGFLWLKFSGEPEGGGWIGTPPPAQKRRALGGGEKAAPKKKPSRHPDFDFYTLLPDQEVVIPEEELRRSEPPAAERKRSAGQAPAAPSRKYLLQVASVRTPREADAVKAKLAFLGLQAQVSRATIKGITWYRVRLGPYSTKAAMQQARKRLSRSGYSSLPIAVK